MKLDQSLKKALDDYMDGRSKHLEMFACAYLKATSIDPRDAELVETRNGSEISWHFRRKK